MQFVLTGQLSAQLEQETGPKWVNVENESVKKQQQVQV